MGFARGTRRPRSPPVLPPEIVRCAVVSTIKRSLRVSTLTSPTPAVPDHETAADQAFARRLALVEQAVELYHRPLLDYLFRLTHNRHDAEDVLQNLWRFALLKLPAEKLLQFGLLRTKAYQLFVDHYRAQKRRPLVLLEEPPDPPAEGSSETVHSAAEEGRLQARFWESLPGIELTDRQRELIWLHARHGYTLGELSTRWGVPVSTLGDWLQLARQRIAAVLNAQR